MQASCVGELLDDMCERGRMKKFRAFRDGYEGRRVLCEQKEFRGFNSRICEMGKLEAVKLQVEMAGKGFKAGIRVYDFLIAASKLEVL